MKSTKRPGASQTAKNVPIACAIHCFTGGFQQVAGAEVRRQLGSNTGAAGGKTTSKKVELLGNEERSSRSRKLAPPKTSCEALTPAAVRGCLIGDGADLNGEEGE